MHLIMRLSSPSGFVVLATLVAMTMAAYLAEHPNKDNALESSFFESNMNYASPARGSRSDKSDGFRKRQSFSVTQDLDALAEMLREASMRRRLQNAIAFFNALKKKRDVESTYGHKLPEIQTKDAN